MSVRVFVDTNILVYARDSAELKKQNVAIEWLSILWRKRTGRISYQCLNEYYVTVTQCLKPGLSKDEARSDIKNLLSWNPATVDQVVLENGWLIQDRYGFSWWDALIVSAALKQDCAIVLSEDMQHQQQIGKLQIINPFKASTAIL